MLESYRTKVDKILARREVFQDNLVALEAQRNEADQDLHIKSEAHLAFQTAANITQDSFKQELGDIVTMGMASVWEDPYDFKVEFVPRRGTMECDLLFERSGNVMHPLDSSGYGAADIASYALRVSYWIMSGSRNSLLWDEPFRNLSPDKHTLASSMMSGLSKKVKTQMILVSHPAGIAEHADRVITAKLVNGVTKISTEDRSCQKKA